MPDLFDNDELLLEPLEQTQDNTPPPAAETKQVKNKSGDQVGTKSEKPAESKDSEQISAQKPAPEHNTSEHTNAAKKAKPAKAAKAETTKTEKTSKPAKKDKKYDKIVADGFGKILKEYLDEQAKQSPEFAERYADPDKNIEECIAYVGSEIFRRAIKCFAAVNSDEIFGMAMHYYQEKSCKAPANSNIAFAVMSQLNAFTPEEKAEIEDISSQEARKEAVEELKKKKVADLKSGKTKLTLSDEEQAEVDAAARDQLIEQSKERQKKNAARRALESEKKKNDHDDTPTLF